MSSTRPPMLAGPIDRNRKDARTGFGERLIIAESRAGVWPKRNAAASGTKRSPAVTAGRLNRRCDMDRGSGRDDVRPLSLPRAKSFGDIVRGIFASLLLRDHR